jgi:hypothetical protein
MGFCRFVGVRPGIWNEGALRMNVGMRVRGGVFAALIMLATPVAATLVASSAFAQAVS